MLCSVGRSCWDVYRQGERVVDFVFDPVWVATVAYNHGAVGNSIHVCNLVPVVVHPHGDMYSVASICFFFS